MNFKIIISVIVLCLVGLTFSAPIPLSDIQRRKDAKDAISIFQPWGGVAGGMIDTVPLHRAQKMAMHDLVHEWVEHYDLKWVNTDPSIPYPGLASAFDPESIKKGLELRKQVLALNPNTILIGEIRFRDAFPNYLPDNHPWWLAGSKPSDQYRKIDFNNTDFQEMTAKKCIALLETGVVDGILFDWATDQYLPFFKAVRKLIGDSAVIVGNTNTNFETIGGILPYINGVFMESWYNPAWNQATYLGRIRQTIMDAEKNLRPPKLICTEIWSQPGLTDVDTKSTPGMPKIAPEQMPLMRAGVTAHYTLTNGYTTFWPKSLGYNHWHIYDDFFNANLGKQSTTPATQINPNAFSKEWEKGTVVYNSPAATGSVTVTFDQERRSQATGVKGKSFSVPIGDGDIFLKSPFQQLYPTKTGFLSTGLPALRALPDPNYKNNPNGILSKNPRIMPLSKSLQSNTILKNQQVIIEKKQEGSKSSYYTTEGRNIKVEDVK